MARAKQGINMIKKDYYSPNELARADWFPINSQTTILKFIAMGEIQALNVSLDNKVKYMIPKKAVGNYLIRKFKGGLKSELAVSREEIAKFLTRFDE